jgi:hypothetical protein
VASEKVFAPECRTPEQMRLANAFCRFRELATGVENIALDVGVIAIARSPAIP